MHVANNITELIGNTPLVKINKLSNGNVFAKLEYFNPAGSIKDRAALCVIENAEQNNLINKDTIIIEATSGNFGIGLALVCATKGYKLILTMPENMSIERQKLLKGMGAEIILTDANLGMQGAVDKALELNKKYPNSLLTKQFENPANPLAHETTTAKEIWQDTEGKVDTVVAGVGTGGTISGIAKYLKSQNKNIKIVAVEPESSQVLSGKTPCTHKIQGIGANFIPQNYNAELIDEIFPVKDSDAIQTAKDLIQKEGILSGISSGAAMHAAIEISKRNPNKNIVVILPDTAERYLSCELFD